MEKNCGKNIFRKRIARLSNQVPFRQLLVPALRCGCVDRHNDVLVGKTDSCGDNVSFDYSPSQILLR
jgi:hypothetical protein